MELLWKLKPGRLDRTPTFNECERIGKTYDDQLIPAMKEREYHRAVEIAYRILQWVPRDPQTWNMLLDALTLARFPPEFVLRVTRQAVRCVPGLQRAHGMRFTAAFSIGEVGEKMDAIRDALEFDVHMPPRLAADLRAQLADLERSAAERPESSARRRDDSPGTPDRTRLLQLPAPGPEGAGLVVEVEDLRAALGNLAGAEQDGPEAVELVLAASDARTANRFDRLLCIDRLQGVRHYPHQQETVLAVLKRFAGRVLLADEVGLGKTIEACLVLDEYMVRRQVRRALILCPPSLIEQWRGELEEKFGIAARTTLDPLFRDDPGEFLDRDGIIVASLAAMRSARHRDHVAARRFDIVVVDEAHRLKNRSSAGWQLVSGLRSRFLLLLSATPIETDLRELYNIVTLLRPGTLGTEAEFRRTFQDPGDPLKPQRTERLRELLAEVMIRNTRAQSGVDLPPRTARTIIVEPGPRHRQIYQELVELARRSAPRRRLLRLLLEQSGSSLGAVARTAAAAGETGDGLGRQLQAIASRAGLLGEDAKVERLLELIPGGKVLVFTRFLATHEQLALALERRAIPFASFTGRMTAAQRIEAVERLRGDAGVMLCSEVGGEGQNLQFCHRLINFDLPWNPMTIEQRIGRIHRIGQEHPVEIVNLCAAGTPEERILRVLEERVNLFELVIGELDMVLGNLEDEREFGERVFDIYAASQGDTDVERGFEALGDDLERARRLHDRSRDAADRVFGDQLGA